MSSETLIKLKEIALRFTPEWDTYLVPDLYIVFFSLRSNPKGRADSYVAAIRDLIAEQSEFSALRIGRSDGPAGAEFGANGELLRMPLGAIVNDALRESNL